MTLKKIELNEFIEGQIETEIREAISRLTVAKTKGKVEPMIDIRYNIEKAEQDIIKLTIELFRRKD